MATLFIVATPIGNLGDISQRAIDTLSSSDLILAEDTRVTKKLLDRFNIEKPVESYHQHSDEEKRYRILNFLASGKNVALVCDAGTPGISDPGNELVDFVVKSKSPDIDIIPIPGSSSVSAALSVCGFDVSQYMFLGFWPKKKHSKMIKMVEAAGIPFAFFESPHRIVKTIKLLSDSLGKERQVFVGRELTKMFELHYRGSLEEVFTMLKDEKNLRGEVVVVVQ